MAVTICIRSYALQPEAISDVLVTLVKMNVELYRSRIVTSSPFRLPWYPDGMSDTAILLDAAMLEQQGHGSCGSLACAYAAWLVVHGSGKGELELLSNGPDAWHVTAIDGKTIYDPQYLGVNRGAVP